MKLHGDQRATRTAREERGSSHLSHQSRFNSDLFFSLLAPRKYVACELGITRRRILYIIAGQGFYEIPIRQLAVNSVDRLAGYINRSLEKGGICQ